MPTYKMPSGKWYCSFYYKDWTGKRRRKKKEGFPTKRQAQAFERDFLQNRAAVPTLPFTALADAYLADAKARVKPQTYKPMTIMIYKHLIPFFGNMPVSEITSLAVNHWQTALIEKHLSKAYTLTVRGLLRSILGYAVKYYGLPRNPAACAERLPPAHKHNIHIWTLADFRRFALLLKDPDDLIAFYLLFWTGMRCGEMLALTWQDVSFSRSTVRINKTLYRLDGKDLINTTKTTASDRTVPIPAFLAAMLADYKRLSYTYDTARIAPMTAQMLRLRLYAVAHRAGVPHIRLHDLRHSHASMLIHAHCSPVEVADRLGHRNANITLSVYSHMYQQERNTITTRLESLK